VLAVSFSIKYIIIIIIPIAESPPEKVLHDHHATSFQWKKLNDSAAQLKTVK
jgi:hypothetical protein